MPLITHTDVLDALALLDLQNDVKLKILSEYCHYLHRLKWHDQYMVWRCLAKQLLQTFSISQTPSLTRGLQHMIFDNPKCWKALLATEVFSWLSMNPLTVLGRQVSPDFKVQYIQTASLKMQEGWSCSHTSYRSLHDAVRRCWLEDAVRGNW